MQTVRSHADRRYFEARKQLSEKFGRQEVFSIADQWPLYAGTKNIARFLSIYELLKQQRAIPGHVAEFGSWHGAMLMFIIKVLQILAPLERRRILSFDTFSGMPTGDRKGYYCGNLETLRSMIDLHDFSHCIEIHQGRIEETLPQALSQDESLQFSFIYCDADLYEPTILALSLCHDRLVSGGVFVLDEWGHADWPGETKAISEFILSHGKEYRMESIPGTAQPTLLLRKI
ncbi:MAG: hypothetical protein F9K38_13250 [Pseudorhodoplanes sp.]|nr:MAG: hypothetical protein F9K38_13250 [Pseudorhodoplanes sp.]